MKTSQAALSKRFSSCLRMQIKMQKALNKELFAINLGLEDFQKS